MSANLNMLQHNQDFLLDKLQEAIKSIHETQSTLSKFLQKQPVEMPSLAPSSNSDPNSNSHSQSLPSDLSYTQEQFDQASAASTSAKHSTAANATHADKKLYPQKYTYDPNNRIAARRWYQDVQSLLSASSYYSSLLNSDGSINLDQENTLPNHNLYNILYRCIDEKLQKVAHSSQWSLGTEILTFIHNTFADNTSFLDDARDAHSTLAAIRWNPYKEELMDFAANVSDLYAKLKNTEYEKIVTPTELRRIWIMALPINIFSAIRGKITTNDQLPPHWSNATAICSLIEATRKEISSQKAHNTLSNMYKKGTQNTNDTPPPTPKDTPGDVTPKKSQNGDNQRHPYQSNIESPFQMMRAIEEDIFQGVPIDDIHKKYIITQDSNTCILCRFKSNHKRYHHTTDCREIKKTYELYNNANNDTKKDVTVYIVSNPCARAFDSPSSGHSLCHDTGSPLHLFNNKEFFSKLKHFPSANRPSVALGDDKTLLPILGYGIVNFLMGQKHIRLKAFYVPTLGINLYSPTEHIKYDHCTYTLAHNKMIIHYPEFQVAIASSDQFTCNITPLTTPMANKPPLFDFTTAKLSTGSQCDDVKLKQLHPSATIPFRATPGSVGYDLTSSQAITIHPHSTVKIPLGFALDVPTSYRCQIASRSSLASKGIVVVGGVIDNDYRGDITVMLSNTTPDIFSLPSHSKIAQLLFIPSALPLITPTTALTPTKRASNGFGSTNTSIPCRRINRQQPTLPTVQELPELEYEDNDPALTPTGSPTTIKHQKQPSSQLPQQSIHVQHPPARLRQTTLDFFLRLEHDRQINPSLNPKDRVPSSAPALVSMTSEMLQKCTGFRNITKITKLLKEHAAPTIDIHDLGRDPFLSRGEVATLPKSRRNTSPVPRPDVYGSIIHYDIGFGSGMSIGGYTHVLFLVDRATRKKFIYGLKSLHHQDIRTAMKEFIKDLGCYPSKMLADRDFKLIGDPIKELFRPNTFDHGNDLNFTGTHLAGAPQGRQNQNGLSEGNWKYICNMARNFLTENLLPRQFWFHALKYAVQVSNYLPIRLTNGHISTPHELAHGVPPDYRKLIPIFAVGYAKVNSTTATQNDKLLSQTVPAILLGNDDQSDGCIFYNPTTKNIIASSDYRLDHSRPSGPVFHLEYEQHGYGFSVLTQDNNPISQAAPFSLGDEVYITSTVNDTPRNIQKGTILNVPLSDDLPYTIQLRDGQILEEYLSSLSPDNPTSSSDISTFQTTIKEYPWITHGSKVTVFFSNKMTTPKQGYLYKSNTHQWSFIPGRSNIKNNRNKPIPLPNFESVAPSLIADHIIAQHWITSKTFMENFNLHKAKTTLARRIILTGSSTPANLTDDMINQHVTDNPANAIATIFKISASSLQSQQEPKLHEHYKLSPKDKQVWDEAYREEYFGLHQDTHTWHYITEAEYQNMKSILGRPLPTMAISKIKRDEKGNPVRAKYRIVVLGNLDPHNWSKSDCFAPVLSAMELRLLVAIATHLRVIPKQCDAIQAFCQTTLPPEEQYVCTPPKGCPLTPPKTYLLLKKTLYGLKRSPRHWYETAKQALLSIGLNPCPNAPCIFSGTIVPGKPPLYVGIYVDDFIYFSSDPSVEKSFETILPSNTNLQIEFNGAIHHFLGIKFSHTKTDDGHVTIHLSQEADIQQLLQDNNLHTATTITKPTPYRSGHPVDAVPHVDMSPSQRHEIETKLRAIIGSLNWISTQTRPDISTITNIIAQYQSNPSPGHLEAAKYVLRYLKGTADCGITFSSKRNTNLESFVKFPVNPDQIHPFSDANWGPQDASTPKSGDPPQELDLFKSRSISGFLLWLFGPLHWVSKRQSITARSSAEAEIYSVDECTKCIQHLTNILHDLHLFHTFTNQGEPIPIQNDNEAAVNWSHNMTTKGLRHIQMRENAVREQVQLGLITVSHIGGKHNLADPFTKEEKDAEHFTTCRDLLVTKYPTSTSTPPSHEHNKTPIADTNGQKCNTAFPRNSSNIIRDAVDVTDRASSLCLLRQARGVLSHARRAMGHTLCLSHPSSHTF
jgi:deoxyuridine 5''-triphosphate nucleotidohydrolase (dut)